MKSSSIRIAMWSGPRNISTAMMRAWENRPDCYVCDEPFYAHYLHCTGLAHPGADEVIASQPTDWRKVADWLCGEIPENQEIFYQKQMAHHLLPDMELDWLAKVTNCFLIRQPREMMTSLIQFIPQPTLEDTGLPQQVRLFEREKNRTGKVPPVLDARDVLENPAELLAKFCSAVGVPFHDSMLNWPAGPRKTDGVWAKHWYRKAEQSCGFAPYRPKNDPVPQALEPLLQRCLELYNTLYAHRLTID